VTVNTIPVGKIVNLVVLDSTKHYGNEGSMAMEISVNVCIYAFIFCTQILLWIIPMI